MAAKTLKGITVEINGKTTGLANALKDVTKTSTALSSNLKEINKALKLDPGNTELLNEKQKILSESVAAARKTRAIEFSTLQRCASHLASRTDVTEAYQVGGAAVEAAMRGETAKMAAIKRLSDQPYRVETEMVDVTKVANFEKKVPADWITEDGMHVNEKFERYARPLIQAELSPIYINGVPRHIHL